ncbi:MAG: 30S ribosomal protein S2 [Acidobacteria bacterium]|nr:30S ribosomal protein S2 [Acidobacteriota bacterium]
MATLTMKELLEAGVHFGHQTRRWNPKMKEFIFGERNGIYIIDLQKTLKMFKDAAQFITDLAAQGRVILFVGTKRQAQEAIAEEAQRCGMYYVNHRWLGGTLTNWTTIEKSIKRYKELEAMEEDGRMDTVPKKEATRLRRELRHYRENLAGIKDLTGRPDAVFVIDSSKEQIAVREARTLAIPVVAVVDTNCDPDEVDHVVPGNDDALRAIRLFASKIADAVLEGRALYEQAQIAAAKAVEAAQVAAGANGEPVPEYAGTPEELEEVAEVYDPNELLPPHLRPRPVPESGQAEEAAPEPAAEESEEKAAGEPGGRSTP